MVIICCLAFNFDVVQCLSVFYPNIEHKVWVLIFLGRVFALFCQLPFCLIDKVARYGTYFGKKKRLNISKHQYWWMMVYNYCSFDKWKKSVHNVCHWRIQTVAFYTILIFWRHLFKVSSIVILSSRNSTLIWDLGRRFSFYLLRRMLGKTTTTSS